MNSHKGQNSKIISEAFMKFCNLIFSDGQLEYVFSSFPVCVLLIAHLNNDQLNFLSPYHKNVVEQNSSTEE